MRASLQGCVRLVSHLVSIWSRSLPEFCCAMRNAQCPVVVMTRPVRKVHEEPDSLVVPVAVEGPPGES